VRRSRCGGCDGQSRVKRLVPVTIGDVLDGHLALDLDCLDRFYVRGYLARLQVGGRVLQFLKHRGYRVPSPACLQQMFNIIRGSRGRPEARRGPVSAGFHSKGCRPRDRLFLSAGSACS
jgi:hypothetical protein